MLFELLNLRVALSLASQSFLKLVELRLLKKVLGRLMVAPS